MTKPRVAPRVRERMVEVPGGAVWTGRYGAGGGAAGDALPLVCLHGGPGFPSF